MFGFEYQVYNYLSYLNKLPLSKSYYYFSCIFINF